MPAMSTLAFSSFPAALTQRAMAHASHAPFIPRCPQHYRPKCGQCRRTAPAAVNGGTASADNTGRDPPPVTASPKTQATPAAMDAPPAHAALQLAPDSANAANLQTPDLEDPPKLSVGDIPGEVLWIDSQTARGPDGQRFESFARSAKRVAVDVEWRPERPWSHLALLQLAVETDCGSTAVFVIDLTSPDERPLPSCIWDALRSCLRRPDVPVYGYGVQHDFDQLHAYAKRHFEGTPFELTFEYVLHLVELRSFARRHFRSGSPPGLARLVRLLAGRTLCKLEQCSDWESRPLRPSQLEYAALDAWSLFLVEDALVATTGLEVSSSRVSATYFANDTKLARRAVADAPGHDLEPLGPDHVALAWTTAIGSDFARQGDAASVARVEHSPCCTGSVADSASALGVRAARIAKCVAFIVAGSKPVVLVASGTARGDHRLVAARYRVSNRQVRMATPSECVNIFGYRPGCLPPVGLRSPEVEILLDPSLRLVVEADADDGLGETLFCSGGSLDQSVRIERLDDLVRASGAEWLDAQPTAAPVTLSNGHVLPVRLVLDHMLGKTARRLRSLSVDTVYPSKRSVEWVLDAARNENRTVVTRDKDLWSAAVQHRIPVYMLQSNQGTGEQVLEITEVFRIEISEEKYLARCTKCNSSDFQQIADKAELGGSVPPRTLTVFDDFWRCGGCQQIYWKGGHFDRACRMLDELREQQQQYRQRRLDGG